MRIPLLVVTLCCLAAGCSTPRLGPVSNADGAPTSQVKVVNASVLPPPGRADQIGADRPYLIGPFDRLIIDVFGISELSQREYQIDAAGSIAFPLVGTIEATGRSPSELAVEIQQRLQGRYVRNPQVTVNLKETLSQRITVDGQVNRPGLYPVIGKLTLMRAVATASGLSDYARLDDVVVFRTVEGQRYAALYNLKAIRRGVYEDPEVFANDVVVVGDSQARRLFAQALQVLPVLSSPLIIALQN